MLLIYYVIVLAISISYCKSINFIDEVHVTYLFSFS